MPKWQGGDVKGILRMAICVIFSLTFVACATTQTVEAPKAETKAPEKAERTIAELWAGIITVDFSQNPPVVSAADVDMEEFEIAVNGLKLRYPAEELRIESETDDEWVFLPPQKCGKPFMIERIIVKKTMHPKDVGFRMEPLEECILTIRGVRYTNFVGITGGAEVYKFSMGNPIQMLELPGPECKKFIEKKGPPS